MLVILFERIFYIGEVAGSQNEYFFVGKIYQFGVASWDLKLLFEFVNVRVKFSLELEVIGDRLISIDICRKFEKVYEDIVFVLLIAV